MVAVATILVLARLDRARSASHWNYRHTIGMVVSIAVLFGGFAWFLWGRESFIGNAHYAAAFPLFGGIVARVVR